MFSLASKTGGGQTGSTNDTYFNYTTLLLHGDGTNGAQNNTFLDSSTNNATVTRQGNTTQGNFVPFNYNYSAYLLGSASQYFTLPTALNTQYGSLATTTYGTKTTIEFWVFTTAIQAITGFVTGVFGNYSATAVNGRYAIGLVGTSATSTQTVRFTYTTGPSSQATVTSTATLTQNTWNHVAVTIDTTTASSSTIILYVNGVGLTFTGQNLSTHTSDPGSAFLVGWYNDSTGAQALTGYLSNFRFSRGSSLIYTGNFTPPTQKFQPTTSTKALLFQSPYLIDDSPYKATITPTTGAAAPTITPFNPYLNYVQPTPTSYSGSFDGTGDYITFPNTTALQMSTGDFTWECWIFINKISTAMGVMGLGTASTGLEISVTSGNNIRASFTATNLTGATTLVQNVWYHVALVRSGSATGNIKIYLNGALEATSVTAITTNFNQTNNLVIGDVRATGTAFNGLISNARITRGIAAYTGTFTVPTSPLASTQSSGTNITAITLPSYSNYFNGTSSYLQTPINTGFDMGTGDFTIEGFVTNNGYAGSQYGRGLFVIYPGASYNQRFLIRINASGNVINMYAFNGSTAYLGSTGIDGTATLNNSSQWYHIAVVRQSGVFKVYVDGVQDIIVSSQTTQSLPTSCLIEVGRTQDGTVPYWNGYISNFRVVKGTAVYTAAFTPPTAPLTDISGTSLLTCQSATFIDNSSNALTITNNGATSLAYFNPFASGVTVLSCQQNQFSDGLNTGTITTNGQAKPNEYNPFGYTTSTALQAYSATVNGGSIYCDGTGDYLTLTGGAKFQFTGDYTVECWIYLQKVTGYQDIIAQYPTAGVFGWVLQMNNGTQLRAIFNNNAAVSNINGSLAITPFQWFHVALVRVGTAQTLYFNGANVGTSTLSGNVGTTTDAVWVGNGGSTDYVQGFIFNPRVIKGTALYKSTFVPPTSPLTAVTNTELLLLGTNYASPDNAIQNNFETAGNAQISTSVYKFSTGSWAFDGTGDFLKQGLSYINTSFDAGDFTIEFWVYPAATPAATRDLIAKGHQSSGSAFGSYLVTINTSNVVAFSASSTGASYNIINNKTIGTAPNTTWTAIAITRSGSSWSAYINGSLASGWPVTSTASLFNASQVNLVIGADSIAGANFNGNLDEIRLTKGIARYTGSTYTLQTAAFPNQ